MSKTTIAEQIAALDNPLPSIDPEDASDTETRAQLVDFEGEDDTSVAPHSKLRKTNLKLLSETDTRYAGRASSRKKIVSWADDADRAPLDAEYEEEEGISDDDDVNGEQSQRIRDHFKKVQEDFEAESSDDEWRDVGSSDDDDDEGSDVDDGSGEEASASGDSSDEGITAFSSTSITDEITKGKATKTQLTLWDAFMENRIKLQKALATANQLPAYDKRAAFIQYGGTSVQESLLASSKQLRKLLKKLIHLQQMLLLGNPITRHIVDGSLAKEQAESDEEIESSDDGSSSLKPESFAKSSADSMKRKLDVGDLGDFLTKRHKEFADFQNDTIEKWYNKTKLSSGKQSAKSFASFDQSAVSQIQQVLQDRTRLIKRTQLRRTVYRRLGETEETSYCKIEDPQENKETAVTVDMHLKDYDEEIFDDDDFYHQLLRELIEKRTLSTTDPVNITRQWLQVQKLRRKIKKRIDTRASKGRKTRYGIHAPLVSFMAAKDSSEMIEDAKNELFSSLFGKRRNLGDE